MTKKTFHLRWNNHLQNLQSLFENLYNEQSLVDVTISCSDGLLYGHKLVLSACSPYFEQVFKDNPCKHPIMILKGIKSHDMRVLLEYMYIGSVDVGEEDLEMLLDIATELQIKGLVQYPEESPLHQSTKLKKIHDSSKDSQNSITSAPGTTQHIDDLRWQAELVPKSSGSKHKDNDSSNKHHNNLRHNSAEEYTMNSNQIMAQHHDESQVDFDPLYSNIEIDEVPTMKEEITEEESKDCMQGDESIDESSENKTNYNLNENKTSDSEEVNFFCHLCSRGFQNKGSYHRHMLTHAGVKPHHCTFCDQSFLRLSHLQRHIRVHTGERPYSCGQCPKQFARSDKLRQHFIVQHNGANGSKTSKPRGRPRKNLLTPSTSSGNVNLNNIYSVSINPISLNAA